MKNKCVYVHKLNGVIVYIGSGSLNRVRNITTRSEKHIAVWHLLSKEVVVDNLTADEAHQIEQQMINEHWDSGNLFNRLKTVSRVFEIKYEEVSKYFIYDETAKCCLRWRVSRSLNRKQGDEAGNYNKFGDYFKTGFDYKVLLTHRIIYCLFLQKDLPTTFVIDHIDGDCLNNKINNLRIVTQSENSRNKKHQLSNTKEQCISEYPESKRFRVSYTENLKVVTKYFSYTNGKKSFGTREAAFSAALEYRNFLVRDGKIILTS